MSESDIPARCLGETGALSFKTPTPQDYKETQELEAILVSMNIFETPEEIAQRREALVRLQEISNKWIREKALEQNLPPHVANSTTGKIFTFGSYRLGVNFCGADIDSLLVVPRFITREEFFEEFRLVLAENPYVEDLYAVVDAFVPVLKMKFMDVEIDLLFAQIDLMSIPDNFNLCENTEQLLRNMDSRDVRSINGVRVTEDMLNLVFKKDTFKTSLKVIRIWAKRRCIYSNSLGFLGGVSWAILVARVCQLYPYATPSMIVCLFFTIFSQWPWPKPVRLRETEHISSLSLPVWDPRINPTDQYHLMPILTPSYPSQNSTYNVQRSNRIIVERELKHGLAIVREVMLRKRTWADLFESAFFFNYKHYVVVIVTGRSLRSFIELCGLVESKLRVLVGNFEQNRFVKMAHVNCQAYGRGPSDEVVQPDGGSSEESSPSHVRKWFIGMEFDRNANASQTCVNHNSPTAGDKQQRLNVDLSENINSFEKSLERGMASSEDPSTSVTVKYAKKSQLSQFISTEDIEEIKRQAAKAAVAAATANAALTGVPPTPSNTIPSCGSVNSGSSGIAVNSTHESDLQTHVSQTNGRSLINEREGVSDPDTPSFMQDNSGAGDQPPGILRRESSSCLNLVIHGETLDPSGEPNETSSQVSQSQAKIEVDSTKRQHVSVEKIINSRVHNSSGPLHCYPNSSESCESVDNSSDAPEMTKRSRLSIVSASDLVSGSDIPQSTASGPLNTLQSAKTAAVSE